MRFVAFAALNAALFGFASTAQAETAEDDAGFYMAVNVGKASLSDPTVIYSDVGGTFGGTGSTDTASATIDTKSATVFGGAVGYDFGTVRPELEVQYGRHNIDSLTFVSVNGSAVSLSAADRTDVCDYLEATSCGGSGNTFVIAGSRVRQLSVMGNVWIDLPIGSGITPYLGGGLGVTGFEVDGEGTGKLAWQLGAGAAVRLTKGVALTLDYRHRSVGSAMVEYDAASGFTITKLSTNSMTAGLRFTF
jgi:opacity protein-like surface antigen